MERAVPRFSDHPLNEILTAIRVQLARSSCAEVVVPHPDRSWGSVPGRRLDGDGAPFIHRPLVAWCDLAERLECRLAVPQPAGEGFVLLKLERLPVTQPWPPGPAEAESKYGAESGFQQLRKLEDPRFLLDYLEALERAAPPPGARVLSLGVNAGEELAAFGLLDPVLAAGLTFVGIDHAASALELARARWPDPRHRFIEADLASLDALELGRFELILALNVMQSPDLDDRALLRTLVQRSVSPGGALVLALPNSRYRGGELLYGARTKNVRQPELSLLVKDIAFYRKYLQQHRFRVNVTGKYQLFVMAKRASWRAGAALGKAVRSRRYTLEPRPSSAGPMASSQPLPPTKEALLRAGKGLILAKGYTATTVDAICAEAGISKGAFYHLFDSKKAFAEELLAFIWTPVQADQEALLEDDVEPLALLERHIDFMAGFLPGDGRLMSILSQELSQEDPEFRKRLRAYFRQWTRLLERMVEVARARYRPDADLSPTGVMEFVVMTIEGAPVISRQFGGAAVERALTHLKRYLRQLLTP